MPLYFYFIVFILIIQTTYLKVGLDATDRFFIVWATREAPKFGIVLGKQESRSPSY